MKGYLLIIGILAIIVSSLITLNIFFQNTLQMEMAEQFNKQQLLLANAQASNIQSYINDLKGHLHQTARFIASLSIDEKKEFLRLADELFKGRENINTDLVLLDQRGDVLFSKWVARKPDITALSDKTGICSKDIIVEQKEQKLYMTAPICREGSFAGAIILGLEIQEMAREFLAPIKSGSRGYAWMMDDKGDLLYHPTQPGMMGRNLYKAGSSCLTCHKSFEIEKKIIEGRVEHYGIYLAPSGEDKVLAYSVARIGPLKWIVAVSAPYSEVTMSIQRAMKFYSWLIIAIFATTSIISAMLIVFHRKKVKAEEAVRHQEELEGYAENLAREVARRTEELSSEKEKLNTIVSAIGSGIILTDNNGRIKWINQAMQELSGKDITGLKCEEVCTDFTVVGSYVLNDMHTEIISNLFSRTDKFYQLTTAPVRGEDGELHGHIRLIQDVTEMKRMEEQMMHSEKLASLGRLTAGVAHEIGNPLTSVFSFVQILKDMEQDEFKKDSLETIYFHINRIADILKQFSGFSKMAPVELKKWKVNNLIETSLSLIQYDKRAKEISIVRDLSPDLPDLVTDGSQLSQVFVNLILNAVDAMPDGGTLTIRSRADNDAITIRFEDTGIGINRENMSRIFDPFFTTKEKGTGLGLAVSYSIIKKLNGDLTVESEPNRGTKFTVSLRLDGVQ